MDEIERKMRKIIFLFLIVGMVLVSGCVSQPEKVEMINYTNSLHGYSFSHPSSWKVPQHWEENYKYVLINDYVIISGDNVILVKTNSTPETLNLGVLGLKAILGKAPSENVNISLFERTVQIEKYGENDWYSIEMYLSEQKLYTHIAGTICNEKEIKIVLVTDSSLKINHEEVFSNILKNFRCQKIISK